MDRVTVSIKRHRKNIISPVLVTETFNNDLKLHRSLCKSSWMTINQSERSVFQNKVPNDIEVIKDESETKIINSIFLQAQDNAEIREQETSENLPNTKQMSFKTLKLLERRKSIDLYFEDKELSKKELQAFSKNSPSTSPKENMFCQYMGSFTPSLQIHQQSSFPESSHVIKTSVARESSNNTNFLPKINYTYPRPSLPLVKIHEGKQKTKHLNNKLIPRVAETYDLKAPCSEEFREVVISLNENKDNQPATDLPAWMLKCNQ